MTQLNGLDIVLEDVDRMPRTGTGMLRKASGRLGARTRVRAVALARRDINP